MKVIIRLVLKLTLTGTEVARYNGLGEACLMNGYKRGRLDKVVNNPTSKIFDGYIWVHI